MRAVIIPYQILLVVGLFGIDARGQEIAEKFKQYRSEAAQEKVYVHTDRDVYLTGETLQLGVYVVDGSLHKAGELSKIAYVELIDAASSAVVQAMINLKDGRGGGSLFLPASLSSGNYVLRAYTRWMRNFNTDYFFHKKVTVVNTFVRMEPVKEQKIEFLAQFFPEGGELVSGIESRVAFKVTDPYGHGLEFHGGVIDERNDTLVRFRPYKFGMGNFLFRPEAGKKYRAVVTTKGQRKTFNLPDATQSGFTLRLRDSGTILTLEASSHAASDGAMMFLFAHARQIIVKAFEKPLLEGTATFEIDMAEVPEGITHFTVFTSDRRPVCERLYFKKPAKKLDLQVSSAEAAYGTRREVVLHLQSPVPASASVSVHRVDSIGGAPEGRILEYLWLTSDLRGLIESPEFYFSEDPGAHEAAENLMLTQGWSRFKWAEVLGNKPAFRFVAENHGHIMEGLVRNASGDTASNVLTYLASPDKIVNVYAARSDNKGRVLFEVRNQYGPRKIVTFNDSTFRVELKRPFDQAPASILASPLQLPPATAERLLERSVAMQVQRIYHEEAIQPVSFDSLAFYGRADETYALDDYTRFPVMEEVLREYVPGVMVRKHKDGFHFVMLNEVTRKLFAEEPTVLLDGVPIDDVDKIMAFDPLRISKLEVMKRTFYNGILRFPGLVSFTTYDGDLAGFEFDKHYVAIDYEGLNLQREVYAPNYEKQSYENLPDPRSLLYWNPSATIDGKVATQFKFYTSDLPGTYVVMVDALGPGGSAGTGVHKFVVK